MMRSIPTRLTIAAMLLAAATHALAGAPSATVTLPPIWTVHIDVVDTAKAATFEGSSAKAMAMRRTILREYSIKATPSWMISSAPGTYLTLRPINKFAELDEPSKIPPDVQQALDERIGPVDAEIQSTISSRFDQIWLLDQKASWIPGPLPATTPQPDYIIVRASRAKVDKLREYTDALVTFRNVLAKANYPIGMLVFRSSYGDGRHLFVLYARSPEVANGAKPLSEVFTQILGNDGTKALNDDLATYSTREAENRAKARPEMSAAEPTAGWLGLPVAK